MPTLSLGSQHRPQVWSATRTTPGTPEAAVRAAGLSYCDRMRIRISRGKTLAARVQESSKCPAVRLHPAPAGGRTCFSRSGAREHAHSMADPTAHWALASECSLRLRHELGWWLFVWCTSVSSLSWDGADRTWPQHPPPVTSLVWHVWNSPEPHGQQRHLAGRLFQGFQGHFPGARARARPLSR